VAEVHRSESFLALRKGFAGLGLIDRKNHSQQGHKGRKDSGRKSLFVAFAALL
jgi:hypothetical protein